MSVVTTRDFDDGTTLISINRPERKNAICADTALQLQQAFAAFDASDQRVAVITGAGDAAFSSGADVAQSDGSGHSVSRLARKRRCGTSAASSVNPPAAMHSRTWAGLAGLTRVSFPQCSHRHRPLAS